MLQRLGTEYHATLSAAQLATSAPPAGRYYRLSEVAKHRSRDDAWIVVDERVYDITRFVANHPGWSQAGQTSTILAIMRNIGTDCSEEFHQVHTESAKALLPQYFVGYLASRSQLPGDVLDAILSFAHWRDAVGFRVCRRVRSAPLQVDGRDLVAAGGVTIEGRVVTKDETQGLGEARIAAPLEAIGVLHFKIRTLRSLRLFVGVRAADGRSCAFDCAAAVHVDGAPASYGERVSPGSVVSMAWRDAGLVFAVDGRSLGKAHTLRGPLSPFVKFENAPGDSVELVYARLELKDAGVARPHALDHRIVVKMLGPEATNFASFNLDPRRATVAKLKRLLKIVLRSRFGNNAVPPDADLDILIHGFVVDQDDLTLADLGVFFIGTTQNCDIYANLPHTVS
ncbi:hypothetical protein CTAYLR_000957 [Chrysophaeum taylorii]|uniref:Cytochrome b5 heme-binding domain-containing protein n=1 Tax=Chrysophaeum taylorii TaxID=2483200 RepID=A0AAD7XMK4_9STRA|nr:hypothetical protein CTAYLR_000957 [Chrysophaeum taylorii]